MVKRFQMLPPLGDSLPIRSQEKLCIDPKNADDLESFRKVIAESPLPRLANTVCQKLLANLIKVLRRLPNDPFAETDPKTGETSSTHDVVQKICNGLALFYVGRRSGMMNMVMHDDSGQMDSRSRDIATWILSEQLERLAGIIGEKQAAVLYSKIETIAERVIKEEFGRLR